MAKAPTTPNRPSAPASRAQQAAQHQGRQPAPAQRAAPARPAPAPASRPNVPATRRATTTALSADEQEMIRRDSGAGQENIEREDIDAPRVKLMQALSAELQAFDDLHAGNFLHTGHDYIFNEPFRAILVHYSKSVILWRPRGMGGGILARSFDGKTWDQPNATFTVQLDPANGGGTVTWNTGDNVAASGLAEFGSMDGPGSPPAAAKMFNFVLMFPDEPELSPAILTFTRSSFKNGRQLLKKIVMANDKITDNGKEVVVPAALWSRVYRVSSFMDSNPRGQEFYNIDTEAVGRTFELNNGDELYQAGRDWWERFKASTISSKVFEQMQGDDDASNDASGDNAKF